MSTWIFTVQFRSVQIYFVNGEFKKRSLVGTFGLLWAREAVTAHLAVYCSCPNRRLSIYFSMNTLLPARPRLSKFICSVWFTLYRCLFVITAPECFIAGAGLKSRTTPLFFAIFPHDLFRIWSLFYVFFLLQIEDAMLMFDKQTNRHRGKSKHTHICCFYWAYNLRHEF